MLDGICLPQRGPLSLSVDQDLFIRRCSGALLIFILPAGLAEAPVLALVVTGLVSRSGNLAG